jgi:hypothetical protein
MIGPHRRNVGLAFGTLVASSATLLCCVLPAVLVSLGAGAAVLGLVSAFPQLVWLSLHKGSVFATAAVLLIATGAMLLTGRRLPCPADPDAARACARLRRVSAVLYGISAVAFVIGFAFVFVIPRLTA